MDERILNERRRHRDRPFDIQPMTSATVAHLSRVRFEHEYLPALVAPDVIEANERTYEPNLAEAMRALGLVQRFGVGIGIARKALGSRLSFVVQPSVVIVIVRAEGA